MGQVIQSTSRSQTMVTTEIACKRDRDKDLQHKHTETRSER